MFDIITPEELWKLKPHILKRIDFIELLLDYGIEVADAYGRYNPDKFSGVWARLNEKD